MASHNIFSDTSLGGVLSFLTAPAAVFPEALLGYSSSLAVGGVPASNLQVFLGISGTAGKLALFGASSSLGDSVVTQTGTGAPSMLTTAGSFTVSEFLLFPKRTAPGGDPSKLYLMMTETNTVVFLTPPSDFSAGKNYYPKLSAAGLSWTEGVPDGGGTPTGVGGSGTADYVAKWTAGTTLGNSLITCSTNSTTVLSTFSIRPSGADVFAVAATAWQILAAVMPDYGATPPSAASRALFWDENTAIKRADAQRTRAWLQVFSQTEVQNLLTGYLPLTGGQLSGRLLISAGDPTFAQKTSTGSSIGYWTGGTSWLLYVGDQSYTYDHAALEYSFTDGTFRVYQYNSSLNPPWQGLAVATQQWVTAGFSPLGHIHTTRPEILNAALGSGTANDTTVLYGDRTWKPAPTGGGGGVTSVTVTGSTPLFSTGNPITSSGTITIGFVAQSAHAFLSGPVSGGSTSPTFRAIDISDITDAALGSGAFSGAVLGLVGGSRQWVAQSSGGGVSGSGAASTVPYFTSSSNPGNLAQTAIKYYPGPSPAQKVDIECSLGVSGATTFTSPYIQMTALTDSTPAKMLGKISDGSLIGVLAVPLLRFSGVGTDDSLYAVQGNTGIWTKFSPGGGGISHANSSDNKYYSSRNGAWNPLVDPALMNQDKPYVLVKLSDNTVVLRELTGTGTLAVE